MSLTEAQVMEKYGDVPLSFRRYWKYEFEFQGTAPDGTEIYALLGGTSDDIYRLSVTRDSTTTLNERDYSSARIVQQGKQTWSASEYRI